MKFKDLKIGTFFTSPGYSPAIFKKVWNDIDPACLGNNPFCAEVLNLSNVVNAIKEYPIHGGYYYFAPDTEVELNTSY